MPNTNLQIDICKKTLIGHSVFRKLKGFKLALKVWNVQTTDDFKLTLLSYLGKQFFLINKRGKLEHVLTILF